MGEVQAGTPCSVCGGYLHLWEVVVVSREARPSWASSAEQVRTSICHQACERDEVGADHDWIREPPQTLLHMLTMQAAGAGPKLEAEGA